MEFKQFESGQFILLILCLCIVPILTDAHAYCYHDQPVFTDVRLVGGSSANQGTLEVLTTFGWFAVCTGNWDNRESTVLCRQLGYIDSCDHHGDIRLVGGISQTEGRVEFCNQGEWGTVCDDGWDTNDATVVCRQLGYPTTGSQAFQSARFGEGTGSIWLDDVNCDGSETSLINCPTHSAIGIHNCGHYEDAGVRCGPAGFQNSSRTCDHHGDIRLIGGRSQTEGRVEFCNQGEWGTVCDDGWDTNDATVVCRQLGYATIGSQAFHRARFGVGTGSIWLAYVNCDGNETSLINCPTYSAIGDHNCGHYEDAGVRCGNLTMKLYYSLSCQGNEETLSDCEPEFRYWSNSCFDSHIVCEVQPCQTNSLRLRGGLIPEQGNVELCINGGWTGVCDTSWDYKDAFVVCRQLGLPATDVLHFTSTYFDSKTYVSRNLHYDCFGNETELTSCRINSSLSCSTNNLAGVYCRGKIVSVECLDGASRLTGGRNKFEGRVEICSNGLWGTVFDGGYWDYNDAAVACRQLFGHQGHARITSFSGRYATRTFGSGTGPILLSNLRCTGNEGNLFQCPHNTFNLNANHGSDVGVRCQEYDAAAIVSCNNGEVRLVGGNTPNKGRVEMCYNGVWGSVCDSSWDNNDAAVVCQQLGFQGANATAISNSQFGEGSGPYHLSSVSCNGHERNLTECSHNPIGYHNCLPGNDAGVRCDEILCSHGDIRLFGGYSDRDGVAEVCIHGYWGDICYDHWDNVDARVFCSQLFGENTFVIPSHCCAQLQSTGNITLANLNCTENYNRIVDCTYTLIQDYNSPECILDESIVACYEQSNCNTGDLRLVGGHASSEGRVEMCSGNNVWGSILTYDYDDTDFDYYDYYVYLYHYYFYDIYWNFEAAEVVCRQLGLPWSWSIPIRNSLYGCGNARYILQTFYGCDGYEQNLINCSWASITAFSLDSDYNCAGVICQGIAPGSSVCEENTTRLVNGSTEMEGRIEICVFENWVTVCDDNWGIAETQTVCKQLGYPLEGSFHITNSPFGVDYSLPIAGGLFCSSEATNVGECLFINRTTNCHYGRSIGVVCQERAFYNISIEALPGPFEIGSVIQLNCTVRPLPDTRAPLTYQWKHLYTTSSTYEQHFTSTVRAYHPAATSYYCYVYRSGSLLGIGHITISVKGLLHALVPTMFVMTQNLETITLQVNTINVEVKDFLRELAWYHNGERVLPDTHQLLSQDNKTLTILNSTEDDSGVYEAMFEGFLVYPHNRYCEQLFVNMLRSYPLLAPVVFQVGTKGFMPQDRDDQGIVINGFPTITSGVIPFTDGDNVTLTARGYVSNKYMEVEQTTMYWFHNGARFSSSLSSIQHVLSLKNDYVSQKFALSSGDFSDSGVYEVQLIVDAYSSYYHHVQCRPYYDNFVGSSNRFERQEIVLSQAEVHLLYVDMLSFSLEMDRPSITQEESATITCSASIKYPPLTSISLAKDEVQLAMTSEKMLNFNTKDISVNVFGIYVCILDASGVELQKEIILKEKGNLQLELNVGTLGQCSSSKNTTDLIEASLCSKIQRECNCNFTVDAFVDTSITCSGSKMKFKTTVEFSANDGHETSSSVINRLVNQAFYSAVSLDVNGSKFTITEAYIQ